MRNVKAMLSAILMLIAFGTQAQVGTTRTTTTSSTTLPDWGVADADSARYYYLPDIESYYDIRNRNFVYMKDGSWVKTNDLPANYSDYDLYSGYKVVLTDDAEPFSNYEKTKMKYAKGYKGDPQKTVKVKQKKDGTVKIKEKNK